MRSRRPLFALACALLSSLALAPGAGAATRVFFLQGEQLVPAARRGTTPADALQALVSGPTRAERQRGFQTAIDPRTPIRGLSVDGDLLRIDLAARIAYGNDAETLTARITQLVYTATALPGVTRVRVLIEGGVPLGVFPGIDASEPLTRRSVAGPRVPPPPADDPVGAGPPQPQLVPVQRRLIALGFLPAGSADGALGTRTQHAIVAFQKWAGLDRDGVVGPLTRAALDRAARPRPVGSGEGRRIEVLLDRQLALLVRGDRVERVIDVATGARATPTLAGSFSVFRKEQRSWSIPFRVWMPWASYFDGGIALHASPDVPSEPASHGCVRVPIQEARGLYDFATIGTEVLVLETSA